MLDLLFHIDVEELKDENFNPSNLEENEQDKKMKIFIKISNMMMK